MPVVMPVADPTQPLHAMPFEAFIKWAHPGMAEWVRGEASQLSVTQGQQHITAFLVTVLSMCA